MLTSLAGTLLVLAATAPNGIGTSPDSIAYLSTARNLIAGKGFLLFNGLPFVSWPPLLPTLLAAIDWAGIDPLVGFRFLNAISFGLIAFISGRWLVQHIRALPLALLGTAATVLLPPLVFVSVWAWSEPLFILFSLLWLLKIESFLREGKRSDYAASTALAALACLTRYSGFAIVLTGTVALQFRMSAGRAQRLVDSALFAALSVLPVSVWMARNLAASSTSTGERTVPSIPLEENVYVTLSTIGHWFTPFELGITQWLFLIVLLGAIGAGVFLGAKKQSATRSEALISILIFVPVYVLFLLASASFTALDPIGDRLLSPIGVPLVILVLSAADNLRAFAAGRINDRPANLLVFVGLGILFAYPMGYAGAVARVSARDGLGFSTPAWKTSSLVRLLGDLPNDRLYTNEPEGVYLATGLAAKRSPRTVYYQSVSPTDDLVHLEEATIADGPTYLAWFDNSNWPNLYSVQQLRQSFDVEPLAVVSDGTLYALSPR